MELDPWQLSEQELIVSSPGYWFYVKALPEAMREFLAPHRTLINDDYLALGKDEPHEKLFEEQMGQLLAYGEAEAHRILTKSGEPDPELALQAEEYLQWIARNVNPETLPLHYQAVWEYYERASEEISASRDFWETLPPEVRHILLDESNVLQPETLPHRPEMLGRALADAQVWSYQSVLLDMYAEMKKNPGQTIEVEIPERRSGRVSPDEWIDDYMENLFFESGSPQKDIGEPAYLAPILESYQEGLARHSRRELENGLAALDPNIVEEIQVARELYANKFRSGPQAGRRHSYQLRNLGRAIGSYLNIFYFHALNQAREMGAVSLKGMGIPPDDFETELSQLAPRREMEWFREGVTESPKVVDNFQKVGDWVNDIMEAWGDMHPLIQGFEDTFKLGWDLEHPVDLLPKLKLVSHILRHAPLYQLMNDAPPAVRSQLYGNLLVLESDHTSSFPQSMARAITVTLGGSLGWFLPPEPHVKPVYIPERPSQFGRPELTTWYPPRPSEAEAEQIKEWYAGQEGKIAEGSELGELWGELFHELARPMTKELSEGYQKLPDPLVIWLDEEIPTMVAASPNSERSVQYAYSLGRLLGQYMSSGYWEAFKFGKDRNIIHPEDYGISPESLEIPVDLPEGMTHMEVNLNLVETLQMLQFVVSENGKRWGRSANPFLEGFHQEFLWADGEDIPLGDLQGLTTELGYYLRVVGEE